MKQNTEFMDFDNANNLLKNYNISNTNAIPQFKTFIESEFQNSDFYIIEVICPVLNTQKYT